MPTPQQIHSARARGYSSGQFVGPGGKTINASAVVDLLASAAQPGRHPGVRRAANALLEWMAEKDWAVTAGAHTGGKEGAAREPDANEHVTVRIGDKGGYHLLLNKSGHLWRITGKHGVDLVPPWLPPVAPIEPQDG